MSCVKYMKPQKSEDGTGYVVAGVGRFHFSTEEDAKVALLLALSVSHVDVGEAFSDIADLRDKYA